MIIEVSPRQSGKTSRIAKLMNLDENSILIVPNMTHAMHFCKEFRIDRTRVLWAKQVMDGILKNKLYSKAYVDELGSVINHIFPKIVYGTHTNEEYLSYDYWIKPKV